MPPSWPSPGPLSGPPKKKRTGLIVTLVVVVVLLGAGIPLGLFAKDYFASTGTTPAATPAPAECRVSAAALDKAGTPSFSGTNQGPGAIVPGLKQVNCSWKPGPDENVRDRTLTVRIAAYSGETATQQAQAALLPVRPGIPPTEVRGLGNRALLVRLVTDSAFGGAELHVLANTTVVTVSLSGWDKGFFSNTAIPQPEADGAVQAVATEVVKQLTR